MKKIKLTQGKYALVDNEDYERLNQWKWYANRQNSTRHRAIWYATRYSLGGTNKRKKLLMHRLIMNTPKEMQTDHLSGDGLDNRRENLKICTQSENLQNSYRHRKGKLVGAYKEVKKYGNKIHVSYKTQKSINCKIVYLGSYPTAELAHKAFMEFGKQNDKERLST